MAVALGGVVWLWLQRRGRPVRGAGRSPSLASVLVRAGVIMAVFGLMLRFAPPPGSSSEGTREPFGGRPGTDVSAEAPPLTRPAPPPETAPMTEGLSPEGSVLVPEETPPPETAPQRGTPDSAPLDLGFLRALGPLLLLLALLGLVVLVFRVLRGDRRLVRADESVDDPATDDEAADAEAGLVASLDEVRAARRVPGSRITAAYYRLLDALEEMGAGRRPHEAPHEHLERALGPLGVGSEPLHRLAALYVQAEFSQRSTTERHRAAAAEALERSLADLRSARARLAGGLP